MTDAAQAYDIAVIGAGFSGAMVAVNLARNSSGRLRVALIERGERTARGVAYGTTDPVHLLNVRATNMGAFREDAKGFYAWLLRQNIAGIDAEGYVPRKIYADYLAEILSQTQDRFKNIAVIHDDAIDVAPAGDGHHIKCAGGTEIDARAVVLATGNFPPGAAASAINPYAPDVRARLMRAESVFLIGMGLTSLDLIATLERANPKVTIHVMSRSGMFPQMHLANIAESYPQFPDEKNLPVTALALLHRVRQEIRRAAARAIPWQSVVDVLRPLNQKIWRALPVAEQKKFLRRLRPYWDTHRHRCAPEIMAARQRLEQQGRLHRHRGDFIGMKPADNGFAVTWRSHAEKRDCTLTVDCAVDCTGPQMDIAKMSDPLVRALVKRNLLLPDALKLGAGTSACGALLDASGKAVGGLYAIGSLRKGSLYETTAVPELRVQAAELADEIAGKFAQR